ncbi:Poly [ADP-ribose] polymerase 1 [Xylographa vitiligo]|nr:Poly [ADP-ribose] polymerase 1 [Xylographa vitiligo]
MTNSDTTAAKTESTVTKSDPTVMKSDSVATNLSSTLTTKIEDKRKKRTRDESIKEENSDVDDADALHAAKKQKDGRQADPKSVNIPVDEGCSLADQKYLTLHKNANKFYRIQLLASASDSYHTWTRWGRVGERGQSALLGDGSHHETFAQFEKKFKDKSGHKWSNRQNPPKKGKYTLIERSYESDSEDDDELPGE